MHSRSSDCEFDAIAHVPSWLSVSSGRFWEGVVDWINVNAYDGISLVRDALFIYLLRPIKEFMLFLPWVGVVVLLGAVGYRLGGLRLGLLCAALTLFIAVAGQWEKAMLSVNLVAIAVAIAAMIGVPVGFMAASSERLHAISEIILDTLQTLPSFVYLDPLSSCCWVLATSQHSSQSFSMRWRRRSATRPAPFARFLHPSSRPPKPSALRHLKYAGA